MLSTWFSHSAFYIKINVITANSYNQLSVAKTKGTGAKYPRRKMSTMLKFFNMTTLQNVSFANKRISILGVNFGGKTCHVASCDVSNERYRYKKNIFFYNFKIYS